MNHEQRDIVGVRAVAVHGRHHGGTASIRGARANGRAQPGDPVVDRAIAARCVGTDGFSIGPADAGASAHLARLPHGMTFVEALAGLRRLPPRGAWFLFLPIRLAGGTGSPGRALAVLPDKRKDQQPRDQEAQNQPDQEAEHEAA
jgi:hypothetical protein